MEKIKTLLDVREKQLLRLKKEKERALKRVPAGSLRVCKHGKRIQYYRRLEPDDSNGKYIPQKDIALAQRLAQKDYDQRILRACEAELSAISKYRTSYPTQNIEAVLGALHTERQKLIIPIRETDEEYIREWENKEYQGLGFYGYQSEYYTMKEERVRSKSEVIIADALNREGIPYRYECPVYLESYGEVYPDFTVLNVRERKEIYWEHLGMMDDPEYAEKAIKKITNYQQSGIFAGENLILTYETKQSPLHQKLVISLIERYLK